MKPTLPLTAALLATACDPCHSWDAVELADPHGLDDGTTLSAIQGAMDTFVQWTARAETCVGRVRLTEELEIRGEPVVGRYNGVSRNISIEAGHEPWSTRDTTVHEFCHAVDHEEGWASLDHAQDLEPYTEGLNAVLYRTEDECTQEAFARICEAGPVLHPLWEQLQASCGIELGDEAIRFVHELAYAAGDSDAELGRFERTMEQWEIEGIDPLECDGCLSMGAGSLVTGQHGLFLLETLYSLDDAGDVAFFLPMLRRIDPDNAAVVESLSLGVFTALPRDENGNPTTTFHGLLGSSSDPLLMDYSDPGSAWRVLVDPLRLEAVAIPALADGDRLSGFEDAGSLLVTRWTAAGNQLATAALGDSAWQPISFEDEETLAEANLVAVDFDTQGAAMLFDGPTGLQVAGTSQDGALDWRQSLPCAGCIAHSIDRLPDGSVLVRPTLSVGESGRQPFPLRFDPVDSTLGSPDGDCDSLVYMLHGVSWNGETWAVYQPWTDDGMGPLTLLRLSFLEL